MEVPARGNKGDHDSNDHSGNDFEQNCRSLIALHLEEEHLNITNRKIIFLKKGGKHSNIRNNQKESTGQ